MSQPIVLDACTIINLLRIDDEEDEFLYKHIIAQNLHIAEKVHVEVRNNYSKNQLSQKQNNYISRCVVDLLNHLCQTGGYHRDDDIIKDLSKQLFVEISNYKGNLAGNLATNNIICTHQSFVNYYFYLPGSYPFSAFSAAFV